MIKKNPIAQKLVTEYRPLQVRYQGLAELMEGIVGRLAKKVRRKYQMVSSRSKDVDGLYEKIVRKKKDEGKQYNHLDEIEDLAGARIIFYFESDRRAFTEDLKSELGGKTILDIQEQIKPNGYRATHVILSLDDSRTSLPEYAEYKGMKCELQITSALYHAWSEAEHDITYKPDGNREKLIELGLDRLRGKFSELHKHIQGASIQLDLIREDYEEIKKVGSLLESDLVKQVIEANNDKAVEILNLMDGFYHKKPDETIAVVQAIFKKEPVEPVVLGMLGSHKILGKTHSEVESAALRLLSHLRYHRPKETLELLIELMGREDVSMKAEAKKILADFSKYDYQFIKTHRNYGPQLTVLDLISQWDTRKRLANFDFVETATHELLGATVEGTEWTKEDTLTMHSSAVSPSDDLRKIRTKTLNLLEGLFQKTKKIDIKLRILTILEQASRSPDHGGNPDITKMIDEDAKHVLRIYKRTVFGKSSRITGRLSIVTEIESRLYWWQVWKLGGSDATDLREKILADEFYKVARLLIGDPSVYFSEDKEAHLQGQREDAVRALAKTITKSSLPKWFKYLNSIAREVGLIDEWKFSSYRAFLTNLSLEKPLLADALLAKGFRENTPLTFFAGSVLEGFRLVGKLELWDKYLKLAVRNKDVNLTRALFNTLFVDRRDTPPKKIREEDINQLKNIVYRRGGFEFLPETKNWQFHVDLFRVICSLLSMTPKAMEPLFRAEIKSQPDIINGFIDIIGFFTFGKTLSISKLSKQTKHLLKQQLIKVPALEWRSQELLLQLADGDLGFILGIFVSRIHREDKIKKDKHPLDLQERYDAVPHNLNPEVANFISQHPDFGDRALELLNKMTKKWSLYNWDVTHLFERVGGVGFMSIVRSAIKKGDQRSLLSAAYCLSTTHGTDLKICMQIIAKATQKKTASLIDGAIFSTGVVSGEYGLADAYEGKANALKPYLKSKSKKVRDYAKKMINSLEKMSLRERQMADEEHERRRIQFEHQQA